MSESTARHARASAPGREGGVDAGARAVLEEIRKSSYNSTAAAAEGADALQELWAHPQKRHFAQATRLAGSTSLTRDERQWSSTRRHFTESTVEGSTVFDDAAAALTGPSAMRADRAQRIRAVTASRVFEPENAQPAPQQPDADDKENSVIGTKDDEEDGERADRKVVMRRSICGRLPIDGEEETLESGLRHFPARNQMLSSDLLAEEQARAAEVQRKQKEEAQRTPMVPCSRAPVGGEDQMGSLLQWG